MTDVDTYIESGILELYVMGNTTAEETAEVEKMAAGYPAVALELNQISKALETYAKCYPLTPGVIIKPTVLSIIDFTERMKNGETVSFPPMLQKNSSVNDYAEWLNREDMALPDDFVDFYGKIIAHNEQATTSIIWLKDGTPPEVHSDELESFLIVEGTCIINIENDEYNLKPGDVLTIPLHKTHFVKVTSSVVCKVILQRVAA